MTTTTSNWLASTDKQVNTTTSDTEVTHIEYADANSATANDMPNATTSILEGAEVATETVPIASNTEGAGVYHPVVILNPNDTDIPEVLPTLSIADIREIWQSKNYEQLHPHFEEGSLVVLPKAQVEQFMEMMRDNMLLMRGLATIATIAQPLVEDSIEGKVLTAFLVDNADIFSGKKELNVVNLMKILPDVLTVIKNVRQLVKKIDTTVLKENEGFLEQFKDVLQRNKNPFIKIFGVLGNGIENVKKLNA